ncbi:hypothetical protein G039_0330770 [Pseudomonas aeruginosa VRFPA01]|nr:hypothetical protein G039_0330770 [Pseudomonas aeruginosa VRFPA01]
MTDDERGLAERRIVGRGDLLQDGLGELHRATIESDVPAGGEDWQSGGWLFHAAQSEAAEPDDLCRNRKLGQRPRWGGFSTKPRQRAPWQPQ